MNTTTRTNPITSNNAFLSVLKPLGLSVVASAVLFGLSGCQSTQSSPVMQRANSTFETTGIGRTKVEAQRNALESAQKSCGRKQPIIIEDSANYNGVLDERTGRMVDQIGSIAGGILGNSMPQLGRDDDYDYNITFRCQ